MKHMKIKTADKIKRYYDEKLRRIRKKKKNKNKL